MLNKPLIEMLLPFSTCLNALKSYFIRVDIHVTRFRNSASSVYARRNLFLQISMTLSEVHNIPGNNLGRLYLYNYVRQMLYNVMYNAAKHIIYGMA